MAKRIAKNKINYYICHKRRNRIIVYSSSSDSEENQDAGTTHDNAIMMKFPVKLEPHDDVQDTSGVPMDQVQGEVPEHNPELVSALGDATDEQPIYGENIQHSLAQLWIPLLKNGLSKEDREKLLKQYQIPENCKLLKAPTLNPEIKAAVSEVTTNRDKNIQLKQDQLGLGITAINNAITLLILGNETQVIKILSDSCRILIDLHFTETQMRRKLITSCLDKSLTPLIKDHERDETLFGEKLSDTIKASKASRIANQKTRPKGDIPSSTHSWNIDDAGPVLRKRHGPPSSRPGEQGGASTSTSTDGVSSVDDDDDTSSGSSCLHTALEIQEPTIQRTYPGRSEVLRTAFTKQGVPMDALEIMMASLDEKTLRNYNSVYKNWWQYCQSKNTDPYKPDLQPVLSFLTEKFSEGAAHGTINMYRSALSLLFGGLLGTNELVKRFIKGTKELDYT